MIKNKNYFESKDKRILLNILSMKIVFATVFFFKFWVQWSVGLNLIKFNFASQNKKRFLGTPTNVLQGQTP